MPVLLVLLGIVANGFDGATEKRFFTCRALFFRQRLFVHKRVTVLIRPFKVVRRRIATNIAIDAGRVYVIGSRDILFHAIVTVGQAFFLFPQTVSADYTDFADLAEIGRIGHIGPISA